MRERAATTGWIYGSYCGYPSPPLFCCMAGKRLKERGIGWQSVLYVLYEERDVTRGPCSVAGAEKSEGVGALTRPRRREIPPTRCFSYQGEIKDLQAESLYQGEALDLAGDPAKRAQTAVEIERGRRGQSRFGSESGRTCADEPS